MKTEGHNKALEPINLGSPKLTKHEIILCERCGTAVECKANAFSKCQCNAVQLTINEIQFICELFDGCLFAKCLFELQQEYLATLIE